MRRLAIVLVTSTCLAVAWPALAQNATPAAAQVDAGPVRYSAAQFFETTTYQMSYPSGFGFSPDGSQLLISNDSSGVFNAYLLPLAGGDPAPVTASTDNATFAVSFFPTDGRILYAYDADDYARRMVFENTGGYGLGAVARDGRHVALVKERTSADNDLYLATIGADAGDPVLITGHDGNISHGVYDFTPDGGTLIYATDEHGEFTQAWTYAVATGATAR